MTAAIPGTWTEGDDEHQHRRRRPGLHLPGRSVRRHARHRCAGADVHAAPRRRSTVGKGTQGTRPDRPAHRRAVGRGLGRRGGRRAHVQHHARLVRRRARARGSSCCRRTASMGVGDEATLMVLRNWTEPVTTQVVGVARTGGLTTTVVNTVTGLTDPAKEPDLEPSAGLLGHRGLGAVHAAGRRQLRGGPEAEGVLAGPGRQAPLAPGRGRPAARPHHRPALGRHPADQGQGERRRDPLRRHRVHRAGLHQVADPHAS